MIDNPATAMDLLAQLQAALPVPARLTPELRASLGAKNAEAPVPPDGAITALHYMGDEGGIVCKLDLGANMQNEAFVSITHLRFDPRLPLARKITAYQKHRVKRLRRQAT
jgi:hypothetical protein